MADTLRRRDPGSDWVRSWSGTSIRRRPQDQPSLRRQSWHRIRPQDTRAAAPAAPTAPSRHVALRWRTSARRRRPVGRSQARGGDGILRMDLGRAAAAPPVHRLARRQARAGGAPRGLTQLADRLYPFIFPYLPPPRRLGHTRLNLLLHNDLEAQHRRRADRMEPARFLPPWRSSVFPHTG